MIESWIDLEKRITSKPIKQLRTDLLNDINFIEKHYGTPRNYYEWSNSKLIEINEKILEFLNIREIAGIQEAAEQTESLMKRLYKICSGKEDIDNEAYQEFYVDFFKCISVPFYGTKVGETPGQFDAYSCTLLRLKGLKRLLETGTAVDTDSKFNEYSKDVTTSANKPKNSDHYG